MPNISIVGENVHFWPKFSFLRKIFIFDENFHFCSRKFPFLAKIFIFAEKLFFWPRFLWSVIINLILVENKIFAIRELKNLLRMSWIPQFVLISSRKGKINFWLFSKKKLKIYHPNCYKGRSASSQIGINFILQNKTFSIIFKFPNLTEKKHEKFYFNIFHHFSHHFWNGYSSTGIFPSFQGNPEKKFPRNIDPKF